MSFVPKAILVYHVKRIEAREAQISQKLKAGAGPEETRELMTRLTSLYTIKKNINIKLGRLSK